MRSHAFLPLARYFSICLEKIVSEFVVNVLWSEVVAFGDRSGTAPELRCKGVFAAFNQKAIKLFDLLHVCHLNCELRMIF